MTIKPKDITFNYTDKGKYLMRIYTPNNNYTNYAKCWFKNIKIEKSTFSSGWCYNIKDIKNNNYNQYNYIPTESNTTFTIDKSTHKCGNYPSVQVWYNYKVIYPNINITDGNITVTLKESIQPQKIIIIGNGNI